MTERRIPETDEELRDFLDHATVGLRWVGTDGRILWANRAELDLVGYSEAEYIGHPIGDFLLDQAAAPDILGRLERGEPVESYETRIRTKDGSIKHVLIHGSGLFRDGLFVHGRLVTRDITRLLEREQAARQRAEATSHLRDEFLGLLSHELRSPLGAILVWLGLLRQGGFEGAERQRALDIIERSARALERIIEDLLHASRIAAGGLMMHSQEVDVHRVIEGAVEAAAGDAAVKGLSLTWGLGAAPMWVRGDPGRLQQAAANLLSNAIKFTPAGGKVHVSLDATAGHVRLCVADTGEGMSPAFLPHAFERFRQEDGTSTRAHHGLGLGLYVVRHVVGQHGGMVSAQSPGSGLGATFTVLLPLAVGAGVAKPLLALHDSGGNGNRSRDGITVLLVDDEEEVREALTLILRQNGMVVTPASSAREAYALVERMQPDILLSDIAMPVEDGLSLIRRVRRLPPGAGGLTPAAALSAYAGASDRRNALQAGFQHHLAKPVDPAFLIDMITKMAHKEASSNG